MLWRRGFATSPPRYRERRCGTWTISRHPTGTLEGPFPGRVRTRARSSSPAARRSFAQRGGACSRARASKSQPTSPTRRGRRKRPSSTGPGSSSSTPRFREAASSPSAASLSGRRARWWSSSRPSSTTKRCSPRFGPAPTASSPRRSARADSSAPSRLRSSGDSVIPRAGVGTLIDQLRGGHAGADVGRRARAAAHAPRGRRDEATPRGDDHQRDRLRARTVGRHRPSAPRLGGEERRDRHAP